MERITSRENPRLKRIVKLMQSRREREKTGLFVAEGIKICLEAAENGIEIQEVFLTDTAAQKYTVQRQPIQERAAVCYRIPDALALKLSDTSTPQGIFCVCRIPAGRLSEQSLPKGNYLALESIQDPGNMGTILRTADAFGLSGVLATYDCPEVYSPKVLRSTMGSAFRVPVCATRDLPGLLRRLGKSHFTYAATLQKGAAPLRSCRLCVPAVIAVGNEGKGLSQQAVGACKSSIYIDMPGKAESLNAGVAASILMWELSRAIKD